MVNKENKLELNLEDDVVGRAIITHKGEKLWPNPKPLPQLDAKKAASPEHKKEETPVDSY
jgi:hypothetical protein